jgi:hypothetical protein
LVAALTLVLVVAALIIGIVIGVLILRYVDRIEDRHEVRRQPPPPPPPPPGGQPRIPSTFTADTLPPALGLRLAGTPADGSVGPVITEAPASVVWVDAGNEVLVHLDSLQTRMLDGALIASLDLETDQTGRSPVLVAFAMGQDGGAGGLIATTTESPAGDPVLTARWGGAVREAVWNSLLGLAADHASERGKSAQTISVKSGSLELQPGTALRLSGARLP